MSAAEAPSYHDQQIACTHCASGCDQPCAAGPPDRLISGFAPEVIGGPLPDEGVSATEVVQKDGRTYYQWCAHKRCQSHSK